MEAMEEKELKLAELEGLERQLKSVAAIKTTN
jgi:hypothetical protein